MSITGFLFYADAFLMLGCAIIAVTVRHLLHAALALMMTLFCTAGLFILLRAEFAALVEVMVYIGGIIVFIVYTILLTSRLGEADSPGSSLPKKLGALAFSLSFCALLLFALWKGHAMEGLPGHVPSVDAGGLVAIGRRLLSSKASGFVIPFEVISLLLLAALIGAVSIARKPLPIEEEEQSR